MYYQTINKKEDYKEDLGSLLRRKYLWIYFIIEGLLGILMLLVHIIMVSSPGSFKVLGAFVSFNFINNLAIIFLITALLWTAIFTTITVIRHRKTYDTNWISKNIRKLPWFIGETADTLLFLNMDHYFEDEETGGNYFRNILQEKNVTFLDIDEIPDGSPFKNHFENRLKKTKDIRMRTLLQLAISEICYSQLKLKNKEFFIKTDYWNYYQNTGSGF